MHFKGIALVWVKLIKKNSCFLAVFSLFVLQNDVSF